VARTNARRSPLTVIGSSIASGAASIGSPAYRLASAKQSRARRISSIAASCAARHRTTIPCFLGRQP
jgi:hypothetical protein